MDIEFYILNYIQKNIKNDMLDIIMPVISLLGTIGAIWLILCFGSLFSKKHKRLGRMLFCDLLVNLIACNLIIKPIVNRIRPYEMNSTIQLIVPPEIDPSFPSGHTFFAFGSATICFMYNKKLGIASYILAFLMAFSRLYLYVHFPTDVLFGAIFGTLMAFAAAKLEKTVFEKHYLRPHKENKTTET